MKYQRHPGNGQARCVKCGHIFWCCFLYFVEDIGYLCYDCLKAEGLVD